MTHEPQDMTYEKLMADIQGALFPAPSSIEQQPDGTYLHTFDITSDTRFTYDGTQDDHGDMHQDHV